MIRSLPVFLALLALAPPASADPEQSKALILELLGNPGDAGLRWGAPEARAGTGGDFVRLPDVRIASPKGGVRVGTVDFLVAPGPSPERWRISMRLPPSLKFLDENDEPTGELRLGENRFDGLWARDFGGFVDYAGTWQEVAWSNIDGETPVTVDRIEMRTDGKEDGPHWTGRIVARATGLAADSNGVTVRIGELSQEYGGEKIAMKAIAEAFNKLRALPQDPSSKEPGLAIIESLPVLFTKLSSVLKLGGMEVTAGGDTLFSLAGAGVEMSFARETAERGVVAFGLGLDGIAVPAMPEVAPNRGGATLRLADLPVGKMWGAFVAALRESEGSDISDAMNSRLEEIMNSAGMRLKVDLALGAPTYSGVLASELRLDPAAGEQKVLGSGLLTLAGLDETLALLAKPPVPEDRQPAIGVAQMLKAFGKPRAAGGNIVYDYALEFLPEGKVTVNGQEFPPGGKN